MSRPTTPRSAGSVAENPAEKAPAGKTPHDDVAKPDLSEHDEPVPDQKPVTLRTALLLVSAFLSMFLVAVDRTIISTACKLRQIEAIAIR